MRDFYHKKASPLIWSPPNRTGNVPISMRDVYFWDWTLSAGISRNTGNNTFTKSGAEGFTGATGSAVSSAKFHVQGKPLNQSSTVCFALQTGTAGLNFNSVDIERALVFGQNGA